MMAGVPIRVVLKLHPHNALFPGGAERIAAAVSAALLGPLTDCAVFIEQGNELVCVREHSRG